MPRSRPSSNYKSAGLFALASRYAVPVMYDTRAYVQAGGLISYGPSMAGMLRQVGTYVGKILNGAPPICRSTGARPDDPSLDPCPRRRGHRMAAAFRVMGCSFSA
jgi:hypothetical protein